MTLAIEAEGLVKRFGTTVALDGVDLAAPAGTVVGLLGPNGSGKTTTVRILAALLRLDEGRAAVGDYDVTSRPMAVRSLIGLTGQFVTVDDQLSGRENLELFGNLAGLGSAERRARAGGSPVVDADTRLTSVPVDDPGLLAETVRRLDAAGVAIADLALRRPSLDDVFLRLTGRRTEQMEQEEAAA